MCVCVCRGDEDDDSGRNGAHIAHLGELEQSAGNGFHHVDAATLYFTKSKFFFFFFHNLDSLNPIHHHNR